jgi:hypothetical protein
MAAIQLPAARTATRCQGRLTEDAPRETRRETTSTAPAVPASASSAPPPEPARLEPLSAPCSSPTTAARARGIAGGARRSAATRIPTRRRESAVAEAGTRAASPSQPATPPASHAAGSVSVTRRARARPPRPASIAIATTASRSSKPRKRWVKPSATGPRPVDDSCACAKPGTSGNAPANRAGARRLTRVPARRRRRPPPPPPRPRREARAARAPSGARGRRRCPSRAAAPSR